MTQPPSNAHHFFIIALRVVALALFALVFLPEISNHIKIYRWIPQVGFSHHLFIVTAMLIKAAILPLILVLVSNVLNNRGSSAPVAA